MEHQTIADLNIEELKNLIREVIVETLTELLGDPDEGLELREDIKEQLLQSIANIKAGGKTIPAEKVADKLGLDW